jgi:uncharacterized protein YjdB
MKFYTMKRVFLFLILGLACTIGMTSCGDENIEPGNVPLTEITTNREDGISVNVRYNTASANMKFNAVPPNANDVNFQLSSADPSVATVEETALGECTVTVLKAGSTVITIRSGNVTKEIPVTGNIEVTSPTEIRLELEDIEPESGTDSTMVFTVPVGNTVEVKANPYPQNANTATEDYVVFDWKSSNTNVATVVEDATTKTAIDKLGTITVVGIGEARITISCGDLKAKYIVIKGVAG